MWPYTDDEAAWLDSKASESDFPAVKIPSSQHLNHYIARGRRLRAEAMATMFRQAGAALRGLVSGPFGQRAGRASPAPDLLAQLADRLRTPLTSIRSSAEILRDNPDLPQDQRKRFLDAVIAEDQRLTRLVDAILEASEVKAGRRRWLIDTASLEKRLTCRPAAAA